MKESLKLGLAGALFLMLGGCGGGTKIGNFDQPSSNSKLTNLLGLGKTGESAADPQARRIHCPQIMVLEGTAAAQFHAGSPPSNANLRHQYSLGDTARECSLEGDQILIKVGMAGKVLLGPAGSPGSFSIPLRVAIVRESDDQPVVSKLYRAAATIAAGATQADFTVISEPMRVPFIRDHADLDYTIKVGIDMAGASEPGPDRPDSARRRPG